jgi:hypothetical protein
MDCKIVGKSGSIRIYKNEPMILIVGSFFEIVVPIPLK